MPAGRVALAACRAGRIDSVVMLNAAIRWGSTSIRRVRGLPPINSMIETSVMLLTSLRSSPAICLNSQPS